MGGPLQVVRAGSRQFGSQSLTSGQHFHTSCRLAAEKSCKKLPVIPTTLLLRARNSGDFCGLGADRHGLSLYLLSAGGIESPVAHHPRREYPMTFLAFGAWCGAGIWRDHSTGSLAL
jgi:hypothetical protein